MAATRITVGSIDRETASQVFPFLAENFQGRRKAIRSVTHAAPEFVFWVYPDGSLYDARDSHLKNTPKGYEHIRDDEPGYGGFLRGRVVRLLGDQLIVVYCRANALSEDSGRISQFVAAMEKMPIPIDSQALVISDNADVYGTIDDLRYRMTELG